jgi:hypothetical protein
MNTWKLHNSKNHGADTISGETLFEAINGSINVLEMRCFIDSNASFSNGKATYFKVSYNSGILGGSGGVEVKLIIEHKRHADGDPESSEYAVWVYADKEDIKGVSDDWYQVQSTWGGRREGSGRPSTGRQKKTFYITEEEHLKLAEYLESLRKG